VGDSDVSVAELLRTGLSHHQAGRRTEADSIYREILARDPTHAEALHRLGQIAKQEGQLPQAAELMQRAIAADGARASYHCHLGIVLCELGRITEAEASLRTALALEPHDADALNQLGTALYLQNRCPEAEVSYREALRLHPDHPMTLNNLGNALRGQRQYAEAEKTYRTVLALNPALAAAHSNLGLLLAELGRFEEADAHYLTALSLAPDNAETHSNRAMMLLMAGPFPEGWEEYEWRWRTRHFAKVIRNLSAPLWNGEALEDRVLLLHAEQGFGDTLQFCRYVPRIRGGRIILEVSAPLIRLLARLPGVSQIVARGEPLPHFDVHCPLLSLPRAFGTTLETIPADTPYLHADPQETLRWQRRLAQLPGLRVGLVWAGGYRPHLAATDARRSLTLQAFGPLAAVRGVSFVSLQTGPPAVQAASSPPGLKLIDVSSELPDFGATAALIQALDLVISVDTAVVHLAGALGKPVWVLNRFDTCWRWLRERTDSPWYPSLRLFRQREPGEWAEVIADVVDALTKFADTSAASLGDLHTRGISLHAQGRLIESEASFREMLRRRPHDPSVLNNLGNAQVARGQFREAETSYRNAIDLHPAFVDPRVNLGRLLTDLGRLNEADAAYVEALRLKPDMTEAHVQRARTLLKAGRLREGWEEYEWRCRKPPMAGEARKFPVPRWNREALGDRVLLLHAEEDIEDTLQFCRYASRIGGGRVILEVQPSLVRLLGSLDGVSEVVARGDPLPPYDLQCPLPSLPRLFGTTMENVPADVPYLSVDAAMAATWRRRLDKLTGLRVGLAWADGSRPHPTGAKARVTGLQAALLSLGEIAGVSLVSLHTVAVAASEAPPPPGLKLIDFSSELHDLDATAALVQAVDLVIGVDGPMVHLAGALGKPVWLLNQYGGSWRWLLERDDSPWYPTLRQFRQKSPGDWREVLAAVRAALHERIA